MSQRKANKQIVNSKKAFHADVRKGSIYSNKDAIHEYLSSREGLTSSAEFLLSKIANDIEDYCLTSDQSAPLRICNTFEEGYAGSWLFQKSYGSPCENFNNKHRYSNNIMTSIYNALGGNIEIQAEHSIERASCFQKTKECFVIFGKVNPAWNKTNCSSIRRNRFEGAAFISNMNIMKDDAVILSKKTGKGIDRYKNEEITSIDVDGIEHFHPANDFYLNFLQPYAALFSSLFSTELFAVLTGGKTIQDIRSSFKQVGHDYNSLWTQICKFRNIDKNVFSSPMLLDGDSVKRTIRVNKKHIS